MGASDGCGCISYRHDDGFGARHRRPARRNGRCAVHPGRKAPRRANCGASSLRPIRPTAMPLWLRAGRNFDARSSAREEPAAKATKSSPCGSVTEEFCIKTTTIRAIAGSMNLRVPLDYRPPAALRDACRPPSRLTAARIKLLPALTIGNSQEVPFIAFWGKREPATKKATGS